MPENNSNYMSRFDRLGVRVGFNDSLMGLASELTISNTRNSISLAVESADRISP